MQKNQIIAIVVAIALIAGLFFIINFTPPKDAKPKPAVGPMMGAPANFDSLLDAAKLKLSPELQQNIMDIEHSVTRGAVVAQQIDMYKQLSTLWQRNGNLGIAAHYWGEAAKLENSEKSLNFAGQLYKKATDDESMPNVKKLWGNEEYAIWEQVLKLNPNDDSAKVSLSLSMIDRGEMMNGILKLRDYADSHPNDLRVQTMMAQFAMQTNQYDKVIERADKIIAVDPNNIDARMLKAEALVESGKIDEARKVLDDAKKIVKNPQFDQQIDKYLEQFNH